VGTAVQIDRRTTRCGWTDLSSTLFEWSSTIGPSSRLSRRPHLRFCLREILPVHCVILLTHQASSLHSGSSCCLSSKMKAFLRDLPGDEGAKRRFHEFQKYQHQTLLGSWLLVLFSQSGIIVHWSLVFSGQAVTSSEHSVSIDWQSSGSDGGLPEIPYYPVLIVQSGAAESGLTLTASSVQNVYAQTCFRKRIRRGIITKIYFTLSHLSCASSQERPTHAGGTISKS
jgi:hypothetical protein